MIRMHTALGLLVLTLSACTYSTAMRHGDNAAAAGNWRAAEVEYRKAADTKDKEDAVQAWTQARENAIEEALDGALMSIDRGAYESAMSDIAYVAGIDGDNPDVHSLRGDCRRAMVRDIENHWQLGNVRTSYTTAVRMKALFPSDEALPGWFDQLRGHFENAANEHLAAKRWEDALDSARTIVEFEPDRADHIAPLEHTILTGWADDLTREAWRHNRSGRKGAAAMLYARAYEIAGRQPDLASARELATKLGDSHRFGLDLRVTGSASRTGALRETLETGLLILEDVGDASRNALTVTIGATGNRCSESRESRPESKDYISGQIEVPNPRFAELTDRLATSETAAIDAKAESERLWPDVQQAERTLAFFDELVGMANGQLQQAVAKLQQAQGQLAKLEAKRAEIDAHLAELALVGPGTEATAAARERDRNKVLDLVAQWQGVVFDEQHNVSMAQREVDGLTFERDPAAKAYDRIQGGYNAVAEDWQNHQRVASETRTALATTPKTVMEDVHETLSYDVHTWTRTCTAPVSVSMRPSWKTELETSERYTPEGSTRDTSHRGHDLAALVEDPKDYPQTDAELWAAADATTASAISSWLSEMVEDYYEVRTLQTTMMLIDDPMRGTDALLGLYVGAPGRVDESTVLTFKSHAKQQYGLENLELLRGDPRSETMASR